jgi:hypothetical protein
MVRAIAKMRRIFLAAAMCASLGGCGPAAADQVSTAFDGNKQLVIAVGFSPNTQSLYVFAWADEPAGTNATIEVNGPLHVHCDGTFLAYPPGDRPETRPILDVGEGITGLQFHVPAGSYSVTVAIPSAGVQLKRAFGAGRGAPDYPTNAYDMPLGCVPIADTRQQLVDYISLYVHAADFRVVHIENPWITPRLLQQAAAADAALSAGDTVTVLQAMTIIRDTLQRVLMGPANIYSAYLFALDSVALLTQAVPAASRSDVVMPRSGTSPIPPLAPRR